MTFCSTSITKSLTAGPPSSKKNNLTHSVLFVYKYLIKYNYYPRRNGKSGRFPPIPNEFVNLTHVSLYKLVGVMLIPMELVSSEFFHKLRVKFQNAKKVCLKNVFFFLKIK